MRIRHILIAKIIFLLCFCSKNTVDSVNPGEFIIYENPVVIEYSAEKEQEIQQKWEEFNNKYKYTENVQYVSFNRISSYLENVQYESTYPLIFRFPFNNIEREEISTAVLEFYDKWKDLFGCSRDNLILRNFSVNPVTDEITVSYTQKSLNGVDKNFVSFHFLTIEINVQGQLLGISSNLVPDVYLKDSGEFPIEEMKNGIPGYTVYTSPEDTIGYTFKEGDEFNLSFGTEVLVVTSETSISIYEARCVTAHSYELDNRLGAFIYYRFYFDIDTGEIIHVR